MDDQKSGKYFPTIPLNWPKLTKPYYKYTQEAPYRALVGVALDSRQPERLPAISCRKVRNQTGLTNRWQLPDSLYGDLLGTSQALRAINMPFDQNLASSLSSRYPSRNPMLLTCLDFGEINEKNWSFLKKTKFNTKHAAEEEDAGSRQPPV